MADSKLHSAHALISPLRSMVGLLDSRLMDHVGQLLDCYLELLDEAELLEQQLQDVMALIADALCEARLLDTADESASLH